MTSAYKDEPYKTCNNCKNLIPCPRNNKYGDVDYLCIISGYFVVGRDKNIEKVKRYSPGGKELSCKWEGKSENT